MNAIEFKHMTQVWKDILFDYVIAFCRKILSKHVEHVIKTERLVVWGIYMYMYMYIFMYPPGTVWYL